MSQSPYLKLTIGGKTVEVSNSEELPIAIDYSLEDPENFQIKKSSEALSLKVPATLMNDDAANTFYDPSVIDSTPGESFRGNQPFLIEETGTEIMKGKAFLSEVAHTDKPQFYTYDLFGDNADWKIDLEELTFYEILSNITFTFTKANIIASWDYDGANPALPYVFAPVKYLAPLEDGYANLVMLDPPRVKNWNMLPTYMKPSISKYWVLFWGFQKAGYRIQSAFMDDPYFRRQVMPWVWGNFLDSDGTRLNTHKFLAKSVADVYFNAEGSNTLPAWDLNVSNDSVDGANDQNNDYSWNATTKEMTWQYKPPHYGILEATFSLSVYFDATVDTGTDLGSSDVELRVQWYRNGVFFDGNDGSAFNSNGNEIVNLSSSGLTATTDVGTKTVFCKSVQVNPADNAGAGTIITAKFYLHTYRAKGGAARITANVLEFKLDYFRTPIGGTINFANYLGFKKFKFIDFLRGVIDEFNLSIQTDPINKVVIIEPTHGYSLNDTKTPTNQGYFKNDFFDWNKKADILKEWTVQNYNDYDRELTFKYKNDSNDGLLKVVQDRNTCILGSGKYVFSDRFKSGKKDFENRFFSPTMHVDFDPWKDITGVSPQIVCLVPENTSNTSNSESSNTFNPKSCYYKGIVSGVGGWVFDGVRENDFPFMFSVNYKEVDNQDPILSYSDEKIPTSSGFKIGFGLLKRFFWQRLAIMREGKYLKAWFRLKNIDVIGKLHREYKVVDGQRYECIQVKGYQPLSDESTQCSIRKWAPISDVDNANTYPSAGNILNNTLSSDYDLKYNPLKCFITDIPNK